MCELLAARCTKDGESFDEHGHENQETRPANEEGGSGRAENAELLWSRNHRRNDRREGIHRLGTDGLDVPKFFRRAVSLSSEAFDLFFASLDISVRFACARRFTTRGADVVIVRRFCLGGIRISNESLEMSDLPIEGDDSGVLLRVKIGQSPPA